MPHDVTMPQLGMTQDTGKIVSWLKNPGDAVAKGDPLFEVETDKATVEVEAQANGFLTGVSAFEGDDAPVGAVIANISESAEDPPPKPDHPKAEDSGDDQQADTLPDGHSITMPQLGMAQDTGLLVNWLKSPGDAISASDVLFEVETDKSTMEVEAGRDGYLAATLANAGEEVPVGTAVAIVSTEKPDQPVARSVASPPEPAPASKASKTASQAAKGQPRTSATPARPPAASPVAGHILASPKARRLAREEGLDLTKLADAGHRQPFHVRDLETLRSMETHAPEAGRATACRHLVANIAKDGVSEFAQWASKTHNLDDADAILCGLAAASLPAPGPVRLERFQDSKTYVLPASRALSGITRTDATPTLTLRDLRGSPLQSVDMGVEATPVLTLMTTNTGVTITLEAGSDQLDAKSAIRLLEDFAGRVEQPLRHLL